MPELRDAASEAEALEALHHAGATDGLPVIVPTPERVAAFVARVDLDPDLPLGMMGPKQGAATVEKVAASAVMAGCTPDHFPVVVAAIRAMCRPEFDLIEVVQTTHCLAPVLIVNGPAREDCGPIASGAGIFGPGNRAAMSIGRAISLALINIAGSRPGVTDMACFSSPSKISCCFAEAEEASPFEPLHKRSGFANDDSVVTVIAVEPPSNFIVEPSGDSRRDAEFILSSIAGIISGPGNLHIYTGGQGTALVVLNPDHAQALAKAGHNPQSIREAVHERAKMPKQEIDALYSNTMYMSPNEDGSVSALRDASQLLLVVAGGPGTYSSVMKAWGFASHQNCLASEPIEVFPSCPSPFG